MAILLDNKKITNYSFIQNGMNSLGYQNLNEIFFDVFEIKNKEFDLIKEKKGDINGDPIVELDVCVENELYKNVRFVLKENSGVKINPNLFDYTKAVVVEKKSQQQVVEKARPQAKLIAEPKISQNKIIPEKKVLKKEQTLVEKTKKEFFGSIKGELIDHLKEEIKAGIIADLLKNNIQDNFESFLGESVNQYKLQKLFQNENNKFRKELIEISEKIARRESLRFAESGGGTNAVQYKNGGTMDGDLTVNGTVLANEITDTRGRELVSKLSFDIIGDGTQNSYVLNHNLNSFKILINVFDKNTHEMVFASVTNVDENNTRIDFSNNLMVGDDYEVIIFG